MSHFKQICDDARWGLYKTTSDKFMVKLIKSLIKNNWFLIKNNWFLIKNKTIVKQWQIDKTIVVLFLNDLRDAVVRNRMGFVSLNDNTSGVRVDNGFDI